METTAIKERPILFSAPMVRAILDGRKTMTRRVVKPQPDNPGTFGISPIWGRGVRMGGNGAYCIHAATNVDGERVDKWIPCPYGKAGDRLWVRENLSMDDAEVWHYSADGTTVTLSEGDPNAAAMISWAHHKEQDYCPSIHMPRWASRILLEVVSVRCERLQDITKEDAGAEGIERNCTQPADAPACIGCANRGSKWCDDEWIDYLSGEDGDPAGSARDSFQSLWQKINGDRDGCTWDTNPYVWVVEFKRIEA